MYKNDTFNRVATRLTYTREKSMRALYYDITKLLYKPCDIIKGMIENVSMTDNSYTQQLLHDVDIV